MQNQSRNCPACRESIRFDARVCKHCGLQYPYLSEPARSHVAAISDLYRNGRTVDEIVAGLVLRGLRPAHGDTWTGELVDKILADHVKDFPAGSTMAVPASANAAAAIPTPMREGAMPSKRGISKTAVLGFLFLVILGAAVLAMLVSSFTSKVTTSSPSPGPRDRGSSSADERSMRELMKTSWVRDAYVSPGHMNVGVLVEEKDWQAPMIGNWVCGVLRRNGSDLSWARFVDIRAVANQGKTVRDAEIALHRCQ